MTFKGVIYWLLPLVPGALPPKWSFTLVNLIKKKKTE